MTLQNTCLYIEGLIPSHDKMIKMTFWDYAKQQNVSEEYPIFCGDNITGDSRYILNNLPKNDWDVIFLEDWPLYIIKIKIDNNKATYYIQYNPESRKTRWILKFNMPINDPMYGSIQLKVNDLLDTIKQQNMQNLKTKISETIVDFYNKSKQFIPINDKYKYIIEKYNSILNKINPQYYYYY